MKVILKQDVKGQGKKGDIITVKDGYGKNYLIKNGYGVQADVGEIKKLATENRKKEQQELEEIAYNTKLKEQLEQLELTFYMKTGKEDQVFGSVSPKQIVSELEKKNIKLDKKKIEEDVPLSSLGTYFVKIHLHKKVVASLKVTLKKESR